MTLTDERPAAVAERARGGRWAGRRAVLRLAQRDARRHRARSALVIAMIAVPVLGLAGVDVVARTAQADVDSRTEARLPATADASLAWFDGRVLQSPDGTSLSSEVSAARSAPDDDEIASAVGADDVLRSTSGSSRVLLDDGRTLRADLLEVDARSPLAAGLVTLETGRLPAAPGEVLVSEAVALATGAAPGSTVVLQPDRELTVVGTAERADTHRGLVGLPGTLLGATGPGSTTWYVSTPEPVTWPDVLRLNDAGYLVVSRAVLDDPPDRADVPLFNGIPTEQDQQQLDVVAFVALAAGMGLLEVVLLAGPAFAVGARRSKRMLALLAACGGDRRQVRDVVLAQGLVLGAVGAAVGLVLGVALGAFAVPLLERYSDTVLPAPVLRPLDLLAIAAVGLVTAVLAALMPARAVSRQDVALALAGRREERRVRRGVPVLGLAMAGVGLLVVIAGVHRRSPLTILLGAALGQVGLVLCTPTIVVLAGRLAPRLPLTPRLALRDAARNIGRTAPAVAAITAAVAGTVAASIFVASVAERDEQLYTAQLPMGQLEVSVPPDLTPADLAAVEAEVQRFVDVEDAAVLRSVEGACEGEDCRFVEAERAEEQRCPLELLDRRPTEAERTAAERDGRCTGVFFGQGFTASVAIDDGTGVPALFGVDDPEVARVLGEGGAAVADPSLLSDGQVRLRVGAPGPDGTSTEEVLLVPGVVLPVPAGSAWLPAPVVLGPDLAARLDLVTGPRALRVVPAAPVSTSAATELQRSFDRGGLDAWVYVERGHDERYGVGLLALVVGAALVTLGAVATSTALAMTDARPDLATMSAVGASRSVRRRMAMTTALVLAVLGTALGAVAGAVPGIAAVRALQGPPDVWVGAQGNDWPLVIPWPSLLVTAFVVPLAAGLLVAAFTRSRLPVVHRRTA